MLNHRLLFIIVLSLGPFAKPALATVLPYRVNCDLGKGASQTIHIDGSTVQLMPRDGTCHVEASDAQGHILYQDTATGMQVSSALDLDGDGRRFLMIQTDSDPNRLSILTLGLHPGVLASVNNGYGFWIEDGCADGHWHIWTADDAFLGDPELADVYHNDLFVAEVALDVHGNKLTDATAGCKPHFDRRITAIRSSLTAREIAAFRNSTIKDAFRSGEVKGDILYIAFAYLYTGRDQAAHEVLRKMWPPYDQERVWQWMLQKRSAGILSRLNGAAT